MSNVLLTRTVEFLLLPPGNLLLAMLLMLVLWRWQGWVRIIMLLSLLQIFLLSSPWVSNWLMHQLQKQHPPNTTLWEHSPQPQAIVVLGAGRNQNALEYGGETTSLSGLERLRYAALLHRQTQIPILVSGGSPQPGKISEAALMRDILQNEFQVPVRWIEDQSHTTWENAQFSDRLLTQDDIRSAWLVTQDWHMTRALFAFKKRQVNYQPAPTSYGTSITWTDGITQWIPQATALQRSIIALHEHIGLIWYKLKS